MEVVPLQNITAESAKCIISSMAKKKEVIYSSKIKKVVYNLHSLGTRWRIDDI